MFVCLFFLPHPPQGPHIKTLLSHKIDLSDSVKIFKTVSADGVVMEETKKVVVKQEKRKRSNYRTSEPEEVKPGFCM